jgi:hypothetical protein
MGAESADHTSCVAGRTQFPGEGCKLRLCIRDFLIFFIVLTHTTAIHRATKLNLSAPVDAK